MGATYEDLVLRLEQVEGKHETVLALRAGGEAAKPALLEGMHHPAWRVRHGCLRVLDHTVVDEATRLAVLKALDDPHRKVRRAALHVLGCEVCKPEGYCGIEGVDLEAVYLRTAVEDRSRAVRRSAMGAFMWRSTLDEHVVDAMRGVLTAEESDDLRTRAARVLAYPEVAGMPKSAERRDKYNGAVESMLRR